MAEKDKLAAYIVDDLFEWFKDERKALLEPQWLRNYDAFRSKYNSDTLQKWKATEGNKWRSKVFCRLTKQKVVTGFNHVAALMIQDGRLPLMLSPSPVPRGAGGELIDPSEAAIRASRMQGVIQDNLVECRADTEYLTSLLEGSIYGLNWLRGPFLRPYESLSANFGVPGSGLYIPPDLVRRFGRYTMARSVVSKPVVSSPSVWNMFWDLESGDYQRGMGIVFLELMTPGRFLELIRGKGYDTAAGKKVAASYRGKDDAGNEIDSLGPLRQQYGNRKRVVPVYTFWGRVPVKYLRSYGLGDGKRDNEELEIYCVCARAGQSTVIRKPVENPLPYRQIYMAKWQDIPHEPGGVGIPEDIEDTQMVVNGLTRAMLDNKALSSNLLLWYNPRFLAPGQNIMTYPGKAFEAAENAENLRQALDFFAPPDVTGNTPQLIELFKQMGDDETGINRTMEGSMGGVRKTAFEVARAGESGNKMIGGVCRNQDNGIIEAMGYGFYHYHMIAGEDDAIKGDYCVEAKGYQSWQDKAVRGAKLMELAQFCLSNEVTARYARAGDFLRELAKMSDFTPDRLFYTDDEINRQAAALAQQVPGMASTGGLDEAA